MKRFLILMFLLFSINSLEAQVHYIGEKFGGGIVCFLTLDSLHGLIVETIDQSKSCNWNDAQIAINTSENHSEEGKKFDDWRLPTIEELALLYYNLNLTNLCSTRVPLCFESDYYWSSDKYVYVDLETEEKSYDYAKFIHLKDATDDWTAIGNSMAVRAVRAF